MEGVRLQERGCPPAEVDRVNRRIPEVMPLEMDFPYQGIDHFLLIGVICGEMKITVVARLFAKRNMDIDAGHETEQTYRHFGYEGRF
jgi:hypothetical protein